MTVSSVSSPARGTTGERIPHRASVAGAEDLILGVLLDDWPYGITCTVDETGLITDLAGRSAPAWAGAGYRSVTLRVPINHPAWSGGVLVLVKDPAEAVTLADLQMPELCWFADRSG